MHTAQTNLPLGVSNSNNGDFDLDLLNVPHFTTLIQVGEWIQEIRNVGGEVDPYITEEITRLQEKAAAVPAFNGLPTCQAFFSFAAAGFLARNCTVKGIARVRLNDVIRTETVDAIRMLEDRATHRAYNLRKAIEEQVTAETSEDLLLQIRLERDTLQSVFRGLRQASLVHGVSHLGTRLNGALGCVDKEAFEENPEAKQAFFSSRRLRKEAAESPRWRALAWMEPGAWWSLL